MANNTYLFSGQGAQYPGMGKELCLDSQVAARIARLRGTLMQQAVPQGEGLMVALQTRDHPAIKQMCEEIAMETGEVISISNYNSNTQVVIAGATEGHNGEFAG